MKSYTPLAVIATGLVLVALGLLMQETMPLIGRAAFQAAGVGSYSSSNYAINLTTYNFVAGLVVALGVAALALDLRRR
jgi:hypothetical protein